jgi:hypothetical protein
MHANPAETDPVPEAAGFDSLRSSCATNTTHPCPRTPCRDFFLQPSNYKGVDNVLVTRFGELMRKLWNGRNFKGQVGVWVWVWVALSSKRHVQRPAHAG